jgi:hypothetical protein
VVLGHRDFWIRGVNIKTPIPQNLISVSIRLSKNVHCLIKQLACHLLPLQATYW